MDRGGDGRRRAGIHGLRVERRGWHHRILCCRSHRHDHCGERMRTSHRAGAAGSPAHPAAERQAGPGEELHGQARDELRPDQDPARRQAGAADHRLVRISGATRLLQRSDVSPGRRELRDPGRRSQWGRLGRAGLHGRRAPAVEPSLHAWDRGDGEDGNGPRRRIGQPVLHRHHPGSAAAGAVRARG